MTAQRIPSDRARRSLAGVAAAVVAPIGVIGLAWVLWAVSDRALWIGPLDRAAFGWAVVVPLLIATVPVAALAWTGLDHRSRIVAAVALGGSVGIVSAASVVASLVKTACDTAPLGTPAGAVAAGALVGAVGGIGLAAAAWLALRGSRSVGRTVALGVGLGVVAVALWGAAFAVAISGPGCARP